MYYFDKYTIRRQYIATDTCLYICIWGNLAIMVAYGLVAAWYNTAAGWYE